MTNHEFTAKYSFNKGSRMPDQSSDYRVAIFGAGGVGKSSIVQRFINGTFNESYNPTIEDTYRTVIGCAQKGVCTLHITDTAGSHQFPAMQRLAISKGDAFLLCYSVSSKQTLEELGPVVTMLKETKGSALANTPILLVANKCDDPSRQVSVELGKKLSEKWGMPVIETSAKENINIREAFQKLLELEKRRQLTLTVDGNAGKKKSKCTLQ